MRRAFSCSSYRPSSLRASTRMARAPRSRGLMASASSALDEGVGEVVAGGGDRGAGGEGGEVLVRLDLERPGRGVVGLLVVGGVAGEAGLLDVRDREVGPGHVVLRQAAQGVLQRGDAGLEVLAGVRHDPGHGRGGRRRTTASDEVAKPMPPETASTRPTPIDDEALALAHAEGPSGTAGCSGGVTRPRDRVPRGRVGLRRSGLAATRGATDAAEQGEEAHADEGHRALDGSGTMPWSRPLVSTTAWPSHPRTGAGRRCCRWPGGPGRGTCR